MINRKVAIGIKNVSCYLLAIMMIFNHSVYYYSATYNGAIQILIMVSTVFVFLTNCKANKRVLSVQGCCLSFLYFILVFLYMGIGVTGNDMMAFVSRYILFIPLTTILFTQEKETEKYYVLSCLSNVIVIIACISLFFWLFGSVFEIVRPASVIVTSWGSLLEGTDIKGGYGYWGLYYEMQECTGATRDYFTWRNCGIFCEGPAYAIFLCIAVTIEVFLKERISKLKVVIISLTILTTFTTTGIFYFVVIGLEYFWLHDRSKIKKKSLMLPILFVIGMVGFLFLLSVKTNRGSINHRMQDYLVGFQYFVKSPIWGYGYGVDTHGEFGAGYTNSLTSALLSGGLMITVIHVYPMLDAVYRLFAEICSKRQIERETIQVFAISLLAMYIFLTNILFKTFVMLLITSFLYAAILREGVRENGKRNKSKIKGILSKI